MYSLHIFFFNPHVLQDMPVISYFEICNKILCCVLWKEGSFSELLQITLEQKYIVVQYIIDFQNLNLSGKFKCLIFKYTENVLMFESAVWKFGYKFYSLCLVCFVSGSCDQSVGFRNMYSTVHFIFFPSKVRKKITF